MDKVLTEKQKHFIKTHARRQSPEQLARAIKADPDTVAEYLDSLNLKMNPAKQRLFSIITFSFPIVMIVLFELVLRLFHYGGDLRLFIPMKSPMSDYFQINNDVARRYFFMQETVPTPGRDLFLKKKPANGYRIFVMGGSTTAGYPYGNNLMFSRILQRRLSDVFPDRTIEIINVAMSAINSYTMMDFIDEIIHQNPDLVLIYAGHNEYYGAMGAGSMESLGRHPALVRFTLKLKRYRLFLLMRDITGFFRKSYSRAVHGASETDPTATLMARIVGKKSIPFESDLYHQGLIQFTDNLGIIFNRCQKAGVQLVIGELVSNFRDQKPFISEATDKFPPANQVYFEARHCESTGRLKEAHSLYTQAKDLDVLRFRAPEAMNVIIHELADQYQAAVVPMKRIFEDISMHHIIGNSLMTDHLHPNMDGYFLMADAFFKSMRSHRFISDQWDSTRIQTPELYKKAWGITELDSANADLSIAYLKGGWPFQPESQPNHTLSAYHPETLAESLSVQILMDPDLNLEKAHLRMGQYYATRKQYHKAFLEYKALITMVPHEMEFYEKAAQMCLKNQEWKKALFILNQSVQLRETPFNSKWIGQIQLMRGNAQAAVPLLEKAHIMAPRDIQVLFNLGRACLETDQVQRAKQVYQRIRMLNPSHQYTRVLGRMIQAENEANTAGNN